MTGHPSGFARDITLREVPPGATLVIADVGGPEEFRHRLYQRGFLPGAIVRVVRRLPFGGPIEVEVRGVRVGLRQRDALLVTGRAQAAPGPAPVV